jgi:hypothetical protein
MLSCEYSGGNFERSSLGSNSMACVILLCCVDVDRLSPETAAFTRPRVRLSTPCGVSGDERMGLDWCRA